MQIPDIWSLLTGIASLISLFLSAGERFASWRKYTLPVAAALGGFTIGRISPSLSSGMDQLFGNPKAAGFILLFFMIIAAITLVAYLLMRHGQVGLAYFVFIIGMISVPTRIMPMYCKMSDVIPLGDLVKLAQIKVTAGEYEQAIKYLESARDKTEKDGIGDVVENYHLFFGLLMRICANRWDRWFLRCFSFDLKKSVKRVTPVCIAQAIG